MPLYEYICKECGAAFERLVTASKRDEVECAKCGSRDTTRQISSFSAGSGGGSSMASAAPRFT